MKKLSVILNLPDVMSLGLSESIIVSEGVHVYINESVLPESISELGLSSERARLVKDSTLGQTLLCPTEPPDDLFHGFNLDMVFNSVSEAEDCSLLNTSYVTMAVADCEFLPTKVLSLIKSVSDIIPIVDPNRTGLSSTLPDASLDASVVYAKSNVVADPMSIEVAEPSNVGSCKKGCQFIPLDQKLFENDCSIDDGKSIKNEQWTTNRFNSWREFV